MRKSLSFQWFSLNLIIFHQRRFYSKSPNWRTWHYKLSPRLKVLKGLDALEVSGEVWPFIKLAEQAAMKTENQCDLGWIKKNHQPEIRQSPFLSNLSGCHHVMSSTTYTPANQELEALVIEGSMFRTATWKGWSFGLCGSTSESMPCNLHHLHKSPNLRPPAVAMTKRLDTAAQSLAWHTGTRWLWDWPTGHVTILWT